MFSSGEWRLYAPAILLFKIDRIAGLIGSILSNNLEFRKRAENLAGVRSGERCKERGCFDLPHFGIKLGR